MCHSFIQENILQYLSCIPLICFLLLLKSEVTLCTLVAVSYTLMLCFCVEVAFITFPAYLTFLSYFLSPLLVLEGLFLIFTIVSKIHCRNTLLMLCLNEKIKSNFAIILCLF